VRSQTYGQLPICKALPPICWYQIILLGDTEAHVNSPWFHSTAGWLVRIKMCVFLNQPLNIVWHKIRLTALITVTFITIIKRALGECKPPPGSCNPNPKPNITWSGSPPKSNQFLLVTHCTLQKISSEFVDNFLWVILLTDRQMDKQVLGKMYRPWRR